MLQNFSLIERENEKNVEKLYVQKHALLTPITHARDLLVATLHFQFFFLSFEFEEKENVFLPCCDFSIQIIM